MWLSRTLCDVLREMRKACETSNYSYLPGLIEEVQTMGNRMEAGLEDKWEMYQEQKRLTKLKRERRELADEIKELEAKLDGLKKESK